MKGKVHKLMRVIDEQGKFLFNARYCLRTTELGYRPPENQKGSESWDEVDCLRCLKRRKHGK